LKVEKKKRKEDAQLMRTKGAFSVFVVTVAEKKLGNARKMKGVPLGLRKEDMERWGGEKGKGLDPGGGKGCCPASRREGIATSQKGGKGKKKTYKGGRRGKKL